MLGNLLGGLGGLLGRPSQSAPARTGFRSYVEVADGDAPYDTEAEVIALQGAAGAGFVLVWEMTVPAQQFIAWGFGSPSMPANQGYMWFAFVDEGTGFDVGNLRLVQDNANRTSKMVVAEVPDQQLHSVTSTTTETAALIDKNEMIPLPEKVEYPLVGEDSHISLEYALITATTTTDAVAFHIPITRYY